MDIKQELNQLLSEIEIKTRNLSIDDNNSSQIEIDTLLESTRKFYDILIDIKSKNFGKYEEPKPIEVSLSESHVNEIKDFIVKSLNDDVEKIKSTLISEIKDSVIANADTTPDKEEPTPKIILNYDEKVSEEVVSDDENQVEKIEVIDEEAVEELVSEPSLEVGKSEILEQEIVEEKVYEDKVVEEPTLEVIEKSEEVEIEKEENNVSEPNLFSEVVSKDSIEPTQEVEQTVESLPEESEEQLSLNDRLSQSSEQINIAEKLSSRKVEDLKKAIGINERFLFINELFQGNFQEYNNAINVLNDTSNINDAMTFVDEKLSSKFDWEGKHETLNEFKNIIKLRYT